MGNQIYYKLICIDEQHAIIAKLNICSSSDATKVKTKRLGRAVVVSIDKGGLEPKELAEINYLLSSVRVHAMAYDEKLSQYDIDEVNKV